MDGDQRHGRTPGRGDNVTTTRAASGNGDSTDLIVATTIFQEIVLRLGGGGSELDEWWRQSTTMALNGGAGSWCSNKCVIREAAPASKRSVDGSQSL